MTDTTHHDRRLARRLAEDPAFQAEFERQARVIGGIDRIVGQLATLRVELGLSEAELARTLGKSSASVGRLLAGAGNAGLATVVAMADALDADVVVKPRNSAASARSG